MTPARPESPPVAATEQVGCVLRQPVVPQSTARVGTVRSMPIVSVRQSEALPATSMMRVASVCAPSAVIVTLRRGLGRAAVERELDR